MAEPPEFEEDAHSVTDRLAAEALIVDVDGFEGPLDLLLMLSRTQKVDLRRVSVLQLAEQYLAFVNEAKVLRIELAADYLVMAAWLAFLKSRLLLPPDQVWQHHCGDQADDGQHDQQFQQREAVPSPVVVGFSHSTHRKGSVSGLWWLSGWLSVFSLRSAGSSESFGPLLRVNCQTVHQSATNSLIPDS